LLLSQVSTLDVATFDYSVEMRVSVSNSLFTTLVETTAQLLEVGAGLWALIFKQLNNNLLALLVASFDIEIDKASSLGVVNHIFMCINGQFLVNNLI